MAPTPPKSRSPLPSSARLGRLQPAKALAPAWVGLGLLFSGALVGCAPNEPEARLPQPAVGTELGLAGCSISDLLGAERGAAASLPTESRAVFVLDTSGSMVGLGDGQADIFAGVKAQILDYVRAERPAEVVLFTFDRGLKSERVYVLPAEMPAFEADMEALQADGNNTYLYRSLAESLPTVQSNRDLLTNVFILTDGQDNDPTEAVSAAEALASYGARGPLDSLHYLALGTEIPPEAQRALGGSAYAEGLTLPVGELPQLRQLGNRLAEVGSGGALATDLAVGTPLQLSAPTLEQPARVVLGAPRVVAGSGVGPNVGTGNIDAGNINAAGGQVSLQSIGEVPAGTPALLCAPPAATGGLTRRTLLRLAGQSTRGLTLLNPAADLSLRPGESVWLHYALSPELRAKGVTPLNTSLEADGLQARVLGPVGPDLTLRLTNAGLSEGAVVVPRWVLPGGTTLSLAPVRGGAGGLGGSGEAEAGQAAGIGAGGEDPAPPTPTAPAESGGDDAATGAGETTGAEESGGPSAALWGSVLLLALLAAGAWWVLRQRAKGSGAAGGQGGGEGPPAQSRSWLERLGRYGGGLGRFPRPAPRKGAPTGALTGETADGLPKASFKGRVRGAERPRRVTTSAAPPNVGGKLHVPGGPPLNEPPTIEGLEFAEDGMVALFSTDGRMVGGPMDLGQHGPTDLGQRAGVPLLSGLRLEQVRGGLRLLRIPADLRVSGGKQLLKAGDTVRPGTLLSVKMADEMRVTTPPLGGLSGLGLPLSLDSDGALLKIVGPYAEHHLSLAGGMTDLGEALGAPALRGLWVMLLQGRVLVADIPARLTLQRPALRGDPSAPRPLRPGTFLPAGTRIVFKGYGEEENTPEAEINKPEDNVPTSPAPTYPEPPAQPRGAADIPVVIRPSDPEGQKDQPTAPKSDKEDL